MNYWLVKSDPDAYSWDNLIKNGKACWDGVRNFQARNNLKLMKNGDLVLFYHSVKNPEIIGVAIVIREAYPDPTAVGETWVAVDLAPVKPLKKSISLYDIKQEQSLKEIALIKQTRLSVMPLTKEHFDIIIKMSK